MISVGTGHSQNRSYQKAIREALSEALPKMGSHPPRAVFVFATSEYKNHYTEILEQIKKQSGTPHVAGASAWGILTENAEVEREAGIGLMAIGGEALECYSFLIPGLQENNFAAGEKVGKFLAENAPGANLLFLFPDAYSFQSPPFLDGLESLYGYIPIVGGASAGDGNEEKTFQFSSERVAYDALSGLVLDGNIRHEIGITRSCQPYGEPFRITRAEGNMIFEMDGRPAYDILLESLSEMESHATGETPDEIFQRVFLGVPLRSFQTDFHQAPYLIRNIMGVNIKKGMLTCVSPVEEGEFVTFAVRDPRHARQDVIEMLESMKPRFYNSPPSFGFYFNCCARGQSLYGHPNEDIVHIQRAFPQTPIAGFFTYGELAPIDHVNHYHHHCGVLVLVGHD